MKYCETENTNSAAGTRSNGSRSGGDGCIMLVVMVVGVVVMVV